MILCENCLTTVSKGRDVPVGPDQGTQRDPYRITRTLCEPCATALLDGKWDVIYERYNKERHIRREDGAEKVTVPNES